MILYNKPINPPYNKIKTSNNRGDYVPWNRNLKVWKDPRSMSSYSFVNNVMGKYSYNPNKYTVTENELTKDFSSTDYLDKNTKKSRSEMTDLYMDPKSYSKYYYSSPVFAERYGEIWRKYGNDKEKILDPYEFFSNMKATRAYYTNNEQAKRNADPRLVTASGTVPKKRISSNGVNIGYVEKKPFFLTNNNRRYRTYNDNGKILMNTSQKLTDQNTMDKSLNMQVPSVFMHEIAHSLYDDRIFPKAFTQEVLKRQNAKAAESKIDSRDAHDKNTEETFADIAAARYLANKAGIFDAATGNIFTGEMLDKLMKKYPNQMVLQRLKRLYKPEDVIWLMNTLAENNNNTENYINA